MPHRTRTGIGVLALLLLTFAACGDPGLETRTYDVSHLEADEAASIAGPYVTADDGDLSIFSGGITVRETPETLDRIARVLERYDRPAPGIRLHFQLIEANGAGERDPRIAAVDSVLRQLFRFEGYRLVEEVQMGAVEGSQSTQVVQAGEQEYGIFARVSQVRATTNGSSVRLAVELRTLAGPALKTTMNVPLGKTVVLGSGRPDPERGALILTVRPEEAEG